MTTDAGKYASRSPGKWFSAHRVPAKNRPYCHVGNPQNGDTFGMDDVYSVDEHGIVRAVFCHSGDVKHAFADLDLAADAPLLLSQRDAAEAENKRLREALERISLVPTGCNMEIPREWIDEGTGEERETLVALIHKCWRDGREEAAEIARAALSPATPTATPTDEGAKATGGGG